MTTLELTGELSFCLEAGRSYNYDLAGPYVGGTALIEALHDAWPETRLGGTHPTLTVMIAHGGQTSLYHGNLWADKGSPDYSTVTPASDPDIWIGTTEPWTDLYERLEALEGQLVHIRIDDGPKPAEPHQQPAPPKPDA